MPQRLKAAAHYCGLPVFAICIALYTPLTFGQEGAAQAETPAAQNQSASQGSTPVQVPTGSASGVTAGQSQLAQAQGKADTAILDWVLANSGPVMGDVRAGGLRVAFTVTPAEGWWDKSGEGKLAWHEAPENNVHLRIFVADLADGRLVPGLNVRATLTDANGNEQTAAVDAGWYPLINAYGGNVPLDANSSYKLRVSIEGTPRHEAYAEEHVEHDTVAEFPPVQIAQETVSGLPLATATAWANEAELLKASNAALSAAITALWQVSPAGVEKQEGDYFVGYALDYAGKAIPLPGAKVRLKNLITFSGNDDIRLELLVRDSRTGRLIAGLKPQASLVSADGKSRGPGELFLVWHPWLTHYERNDRIARKEIYKLRVHFDAPGYRRWGKQSDRFAAPGEVEFDGVTLKPVKSEKTEKNEDAGKQD